MKKKKDWALLISTLFTTWNALNCLHKRGGSDDELPLQMAGNILDIHAAFREVYYRRKTDTRVSDFNFQLGTQG